jgi:GxxExxY protein
MNLRGWGLEFTRQEMVPVSYGGIQIEHGFRADMIVESKVIVEIKAVEAISPIHKRQLRTYLKLSNKRLGLLINFNVILIKDGIARVVNGLDPAFRV